MVTSLGKYITKSLVAMLQIVQYQHEYSRWKWAKSIPAETSEPPGPTYQFYIDET